MSKTILSLGAALLLTACASQSPQAGHENLSQALHQAGGTANVQSTNNGPVLICSDTPMLGSHISHVDCVTPEEAAARQKAAQAAMQLRTATPTQVPGGPP